ncbi:acyl-CoA carboxylase subunit epsilon [Streptomyces sp. ODS05-4]|uniref:acyl-CoA carboxylase subunit epsilon n=1 Tax=Streptomyces sp. ODS05-4 TaxID=2944939 RepID=UPI00210968F7|nr:acyl-CoA carboxylase subunit epsilon [Streptomyces sp. ODS05-4]
MDDKGKDGARALLRVERGHADERELAALALVLCSLLAAGKAAEPTAPAPGGEQSAVSWARPERMLPYRAPGSWR